MRNSIKFLGALAVAGLVAAGGSAFTAGGLIRSAPADQFIGGSVSQTITGATLLTTQYIVASNNYVTGIDLAFDAAAAGKTLVVTLGGSPYTCSKIALDTDDQIVESTCTPTSPSTGVLNTASSPLTVTVTEPLPTPTETEP